ncbi:hypothetical protein CR513_58371, partial [Mucuna pruriens]
MARNCSVYHISLERSLAATVVFASGTHIRLCALGTVRPGLSSMLTLASLPFNICPCGPTTCRSKHWITDASNVAIPEVAKFTPGHILLPDPNGRN